LSKFVHCNIVSLSHSLVDQAEAAYQRGDYMDKRKLLMSDWANYCYSINK